MRFGIGNWLPSDTFNMIADWTGRFVPGGGSVETTWPLGRLLSAGPTRMIWKPAVFRFVVARSTFCPDTSGTRRDPGPVLTWMVMSLVTTDICPAAGTV